ncbi:hypothetical protein G4X40_00990 [Rhodococcus sp. D2-41]|uniref:hypothetical protein n=1 Tax=Speluncibacter jeojiensis TaxID=2710754 RepID=UPI00240F4165|nr:hypothetical protein [Rhodococcus sp. D2-41]MDG3008717.1 hypothetical protein [Rhodococcus sp. D2-41]
MRRYPKTERALGYLEAYAAVGRLPGAVPGMDSDPDVASQPGVPGWDGECEAAG